MAKHNHLTLSDRISIETGLAQANSFKCIAQTIEKDCSTISKEVRKHAIWRDVGGNFIGFNDCIHAFLHQCTKRRICKLEDCISRSRNRPCWSCRGCRRVCSDYQPYSCPKLKHPPYVCNGCPNLRHCQLRKRIYQAQAAHDNYKSTLSSAREGISINPIELQHLDSIISPALDQGQSLHHICVTHKNEILQSLPTLYKYINLGVFTARNIDMPRVVRFRPRKKPGPTLKIDRICRHGRTYQDYLNFIADHPNLPVRQLDTVEGIRGGAVLLTIHIIEASFQLAFLLTNKTAQSVIDIFSYLFALLGEETYDMLFPGLLTDNGSEFSNPTSLEWIISNHQHSHLFYCDAGKPYQKGSCENNHSLIRRCIPKGTNLDTFTQEDINLMMSHINSYTRSKLGNKSAYEVLAFMYGEDLPTRLGIQFVPPEEINLTPQLFNK